jgi:hypothetical protein
VPALGILLGIRALVEIRANPTIGGRSLAKSGIAIGVAVCLFWVAGLVWWHFNARQPMMNGPVEELRAAYSGDLGQFKSGFTAAGESAADDEAERFVAELKTRFGAFRDSALSNTPQTQATLAGRPVLRIAYTLHFDRGLVEAEASFVTFGETRSILPTFVFEWDWLRIIDPERGDLVYPESARAAATTPPPAPQTQPRP